MIAQSRTLFDSVFDSKHVATEEIVKLFENILLSKNEYTDITNYNIAYFLAHRQHIATPFEFFAEKVKGNYVWTRIIYVDVNFLNLRKKMDQKTYVRIRRKMKQNKFYIQSILKGNVTNYVEKKLKA